MASLIEAILMYIGKIITALGYWGVGGGMVLESACIPLPSEVVLPLGGYMASNSTATLLGVNIAAACGSLIGSLLAYMVGYNGGRNFILKYGKYFFMSEKNFYHAEKTFNKHGAAAVFFGRLLPVVRTFISLPAGIARMNLGKFVVYSLAGMLPWNFLLIYLGFKFGENYDKIVRPIFHRFEYVVIGVIVLAFVFIIMKHMKSRKNGVT